MKFEFYSNVSLFEDERNAKADSYKEKLEHKQQNFSTSKYAGTLFDTR